MKAKRQEVIDIPVKKNETIETEVVDLSHEGLGVCKVDGYPLFVPDALPGEFVQIKVLKTQKHYGYGKVLCRYTDSPNRVEAMDTPLFQTGTLPLAHLAYEAQLKFKKQQVEIVMHKAGIENVTVLDVIGMGEPWHYRNKAQVPIGGQPGHLYSGFYRQRSHEIIPISDYRIQDQALDEAIQVLLAVFNRYKLSAYDEKTGQGLLRYLQVRRGYYTKEMQVVIVANAKTLPNEAAIVSHICQALPEMVSLILNCNTKVTNVILGQQERCLWGQNVFHDDLLGHRFAISSRSFFQVNTRQAEQLYQVVKEGLDLQGRETLLDAYCGLGTIGICLADTAGEIYGVEILPEAIALAKENAQANSQNKVHFEAGDASTILYRWAEAGVKFDAAVVDPPRKGLSPEFIDTLIDLAPKQIAYVSCKPSTCARDLKRLIEAGYQVGPIQPVDMFPHTPHVETVCLMTRVR